MKKYYPKIKFGINLDLEKKFFRIFSNERRAIRPELKFLLNKPFIKSREKFLFAFVENYFEIHKKEIKNDIINAGDSWRKVEKYFYREVDKIFYGYPWPDGDYYGYASIWRMFPRFIKMKTFAFPVDPNRFKRKITLSVIAHEMLHFITYDYLEKKYNLKPSESGSKDKTFWCFTENLNVLIENGKRWYKFTGGVNIKPYKDCRILYNRMKKIWDKNKDIDNLIVKVFNLSSRAATRDPG